MLQERHDKLLNTFEFLQLQKGEVFASSVDTGHEDFAFKELTFQENVVERQLLDVKRILSSVIIVPDFSQNKETLQIGHVAELFFREDGIAVHFQVGGFGDSNFLAKPVIVEYTSPIIFPFFGCEAGHEVVVQVKGVKKTSFFKRFSDRILRLLLK
ncbi:MAG: hypothetical protein IPN70_05450 [Candidatus Moraniibacteriota bacterium]|nr:MAG: hypothetical protein IPN70_05450 [Candidatus Moranbacteria bacterium]